MNFFMVYLFNLKTYQNHAIKTEILYIMKKLIYFIGIFLIAGLLFGGVAYAQNQAPTKKEKNIIWSNCEKRKKEA